MLHRHSAGESLFEYMNSLERRRVPYHAVAHSHGGAVLWGALRIADLSRKHSGPRGEGPGSENDSSGPALKWLRSCTAVGTPFIIFKSLRSSTHQLWTIEIVALIIQFLVPVIVSAALFPFLGWWALAALASIVFLVPLVEVLTFPKKFAALQEVDEQIARQYGRHWLSIWSDDDEAINLLRAAIRVQQKRFGFRPSLPTIPNRDMNRLLKVLFFGETFFLYLYDRFIVPTLARIAIRRIGASILGVKHLSGIARVSPWPCPQLEAESVLSAETKKKLKQDADTHLSKATPRLRQSLELLGSGVTQNPLRTMEESALRELIHTSYFENEDVVALIAKHISSASMDFPQRDL